MELWIDDLLKTSITKTDLVVPLVENMGVTQREARELVDGFFDILTNELKRGRTVKLANFGTFRILKKAARPGRNLRTSEQVLVSARRSVTFFAGPKLRHLMRQRDEVARPEMRATQAGGLGNERSENRVPSP